MGDLTRAQFAEAWNQFGRHVAWFTQSINGDRSQDAAKVRLVVAEWDEVLAPHLDLLAAEARRVAEQSIVPRIKTLRAELRRLFLERLLETVNGRLDWLVTEQFMKLPGLLKRLPAADQAEASRLMSALTRRLFDCDYEPMAVFRRGEQLADEQEAAWRRKLALLRREWGGEMTPEMERRLENSDLPSLKHWFEEISTAIAALGRAQPPRTQKSRD